jgi:hypothetical protein
MDGTTLARVLNHRPPGTAAKRGTLARCRLAASGSARAGAVACGGSCSPYHRRDHSERLALAPLANLPLSEWRGFPPTASESDGPVTHLHHQSANGR